MTGVCLQTAEPLYEFAPIEPPHLYMSERIKGWIEMAHVVTTSLR